MDSRLIYVSSKAYNYKINWEKTKYPDSEWSSISDDNLLGQEQLGLIIDEYFGTDVLHISVGRRNSFTTNKSNVLSQIEELRKQHNFHVWDETFTKTIEFNKIGIFRRGKISG